MSKLEKVIIYLAIFAFIFGIYSFVWRVDSIDKQLNILVNREWQTVRENTVYPNDSLLDIALRKYWQDEKTACIVIYKTEKGGGEWDFESYEEMVDSLKINHCGR